MGQALDEPADPVRALLLKCPFPVCPLKVIDLSSAGESDPKTSWDLPGDDLLGIMEADCTIVFGHTLTDVGPFVCGLGFRHCLQTHPSRWG